MKKRQTMGKMMRDRELRERRALKQQRKDERSAASGASPMAPTSADGAEGEPTGRACQTGAKARRRAACAVATAASQLGAARPRGGRSRASLRGMDVSAADAQRARRGADGAVPARPARGGAQGGPAPHRDRLRPSALTDNLDGEVKPKSYFIFSFDQKPLAELGEAAMPAAARGDRAERRPLRAAAHDRLGARQPRLALPRARATRTAALRLSLEGATLADVALPPMPEYYRHPLANGKTVMETAPTIQWGYLIYLTVLRLCQYFGAKEECGFCDINHNWRQHKQQGRPYTGVKPVDDVLEALALIDRYDTGAGEPGLHAHRRLGHEHRRRARARPTSTGATPRRSRSASPGAGSARSSPRRCRRAEVQRYQGLRHHDLPPQLRGVGRAPVRAHLAGQAALRRARGVAPAHPRRRRGVRARAT